MLLDVSGAIQPPSEIVRRLQQIDPRLGLLWTPLGESALGEVSGRWGVTMKWQPDDRRYKYIQSGDVPPDTDHDIVVFLPKDCSVDEAYGYFVSSVRRSGSAEVRAMIDRVQAWNHAQTDRNWQPVMDQAMEEVESMAHGLYSGGSTAKRRKRGQ